MLHKTTKALGLLPRSIFNIVTDDHKGETANESRGRSAFSSSSSQERFSDSGFATGPFGTHRRRRKDTVMLFGGNAGDGVGGAPSSLAACLEQWSPDFLILLL